MILFSKGMNSVRKTFVSRRWRVTPMGVSLRGAPDGFNMESFSFSNTSSLDFVLEKAY
jgi:hypothetical protein